MNTEELISTLESNGLLPISVVFGGGKDTNIFIKGDLEYFIKSVKALGEIAVFVEEYAFDESGFEHEVDSEIYGDYDVNRVESEEDRDSNSIYLPSVLPQLDKFKQYIGETAFLGLTVFFKERRLSFIYNMEWHSEFENLYEEAVEKFKENENELRKKAERSKAVSEAAKLNQEKILTEKLKTLINDKKFARLSTQRAMQSYALEVISGLDELSPEILKAEIQLLSDRIKAKKILAE